MIFYYIGKSQMVTTDGSRRLYTITGLNKAQRYQFKLSALTVNGSGPATPWTIATTFVTDLDESVVPNSPYGLKAKAQANTITISWKPPRDNKILVRGYTIGWGKGIPDVYTKVVDAKVREYEIKDLKPNSEYVISLKAYNDIGDGRPVYDTTRTREQNDDDFAFNSPLPPPIGLHARILSSKAALLTWMDSSLPENQFIPDNRYYIIRYTVTKTIHNGKARHQYKNCSDLNFMIDDLR